MQVQTSELEGIALDWAVAKCEGVVSDDIDDFCLSTPGEFAYSTSWAQGGPIIERGVAELYEHKALECWAAKSKAGDLRYGQTPLIAAMRCYVASKLGDTVDVPEELL